MIIESFLVCFVQFYFLTQTDDFAKAIAHGLRPFLLYIQNGLIFRIFDLF